MKQSFHKIGGPGLIVEVDESHVWKNKYHVGRVTVNQRADVWAFGAKCVETGEVYLRYTEYRNAEACQKFIKTHCRYNLSSLSV